VSIKKALSRIGIALSVAATVAIGQTNPNGSVKIGTLTWTKQNINIKTPDSWCYEDKDSNCAKYGRLYTWEAANKACQSMGGKWRLPTRDDWNKLIEATGDERFAGKKLKSKAGWDDYEGESGNGTDDFGFSALPGGIRYSNGSFHYVGYHGHWWSATEYGSGDAYLRDVGSGFDSVIEGSYDKKSGFSVRCAQD
jgi:uncharacterized protein (TIGR02145 family)